MRCLAAIVLLNGCAVEQQTGWMGVGRLDEHDDGSQDETFHRRLDPAFRVMWEEWFSPLVDTLPGWRSTFTYDERGFVLEETYDLYGDGILDRWNVWTRDGEGRPLVEERLDADGETKAVISFTYDDTLLVEVRVESSGPDWEDDLATWTYDADGRMLSVEHDYRIDGRIDRREEQSFSAPAPSLDGQYRLDVDGDGLWELDRTSSYDIGGRMVHSQGFEYGVTVIRDVDFDGLGHMISSRATTTRAKSIDTWRYDERGLLQDHVSGFQAIAEDAGTDEVTREQWDWTPVEE